MARKKRNLTYPVDNLKNLGAEYIHSNWLYFENTIEKKKNGEDLLTRGAIILHQGILKILRQEMDYYRQAEKVYIRETNKNLNRGYTLSRERLKDVFESQYKKHLADPGTRIGRLEKLKIKSLGATRWPKYKDFKMKDQQEIEDSLAAGATTRRGRSRQDLAQDLVSSTEVILAMLRKAQNDSRLGSYSVKKPEIYGEKDLKIGDEKFRNLIIEQIKTIRKTISEGKTELSEAREINKILDAISIHSYFGRVAEEYTPGFINNYLAAFTNQVTNEKGKKKGTARIEADRFKNWNVIDTFLKEIQIENQKIQVGLSQKYTKHSYFESTYKVHNDIYQIVNSYGKLKLERGHELEQHSSFLMYIRKNLASLNSWALDKPKGVIDYDTFISREVAIAFLINFLRFLNGFSYLIENGDFSPFVDKNDLEHPIIFNVFLMTRHGVFYTLDILEALYEVVENFEKLIFGKTDKGSFKFKIDGFSATAKIKNLPNVSSSALQLWQKKQKALKLLSRNQEEITYQNIESIVSQEIKSLGDIAGELLVDEIRYYVNPPVLVKK